jgi:RecA-family ATPase
VSAAVAVRPKPGSKLGSLAVEVGDAWLTVALPPREHLLSDGRTGKGAVDKAGTWLFAGAGGTGKSYATLDLALAVATGGSWFGLNATGKGRVLLVVAEDDADDLRRRLKRVADARYPGAKVAGKITILPLRGKSVSFVNQDRFTGSFSQGEGLRDVIGYVEEARAAAGSAFDLTIIDPISRFAGVGLDKDSAAATAFIDACDALSMAAGGLVLGICHTNKMSRSADKGAAESADVRGSTGLTDGARGVLQLVPEADKLTKKLTDKVVLSITKGNHVPRWNDIVLRRGDDGVLEPLDAADHAEWIVAHRAKTPEERVAKKEADRDAREDQRAANEVERSAWKRAANNAKREAEKRLEIEADIQSVLGIMAEGHTGTLRDVVEKRFGWGTRRAQRAVSGARVAGGSAAGVLAHARENPPYPLVPEHTGHTGGCAGVSGCATEHTEHSEHTGHSEHHPAVVSPDEDGVHDDNDEEETT